MDKLLEGIGEVFKTLIAVSPATGVLFLLVVAMAFVIRHLYHKLTDAQTLALAQVKEYEKLRQESEREIRREYQLKIEKLECDIALLHQHNNDRDISNTNILEGLRVAIRSGNTKQFLQSLWNGVAALGKVNGMDIEEMKMLVHVNQDLTP